MSVFQKAITHDCTHDCLDEVYDNSLHDVFFVETNLQGSMDLIKSARVTPLNSVGS